jgi:glycosyltransferase A (GT-A) superfamily protein (DUF2064 family)
MESMPMNGSQAALVVFVKTPGLSPIKTRLAKELGRECADEFFRLSLAAIEVSVESAAKANDFCPYWAIAEQGALMDPRWRRFERVSQGTGRLGERLAHVFNALQHRHKVVVAIGADSPQITPAVLGDAIRFLQYDRMDDAHVLGRCHDGGFYIVGTNHPLSPETWRDVPYSTSSAADHLAANLARQGSVHELPRLTDVDQIDDLVVLREELKTISDPSPDQLAVLGWLAATIGAIKDDSPPSSV